MADQPPNYIGLNVECGLDRAAREAVTRVNTGTHLYSAFDGKGVLVSDDGGCAIGYIDDECADEVASWMRRGWFFETRCIALQPCIFHWAHLAVNLHPITPRATSTKTSTKTTQKETVDA